ncbi:MAG: YceI family protein [Sciscionella sp.]
MTVPGYVPTSWEIDPVHTEVAFAVRHLGLAKVRGRFDKFTGQIVTAEDILESSVNITIDAASLNTNDAQRDAHVRSEDFLHTDEHSEWTFASTGIRADGDDYIITGDLTIHGVTKQVDLNAELGGFADGPTGAPTIGVSATTTLDRRDFGISGAQGALGNKITIELEVEATRQA